MARQVNRIVALHLRASPRASASFEERKTSIPLEYMVSLSMPRILYDGIRTMKSEELVLAGLGNLDRAREARRGRRPSGSIPATARRRRWTSSSTRSAG